jgi:hypothetical protein
MSASERLAKHASQHMVAPQESLIDPALSAGQPVFDQVVARTARDITNMIPV